MLNPSAVFTLAFSLSETFLVSNNISFKGEKDLSTKSLCPGLPDLQYCHPYSPAGRLRTLPASDRYTCGRTKHRAAPAAPSRRERSPGL